MAQLVDTNCKTFEADEAVAQYLRVKLDGDGKVTTEGGCSVSCNDGFYITDGSTGAKTCTAEKVRASGARYLRLRPRIDPIGPLVILFFALQAHPHLLEYPS